MNEQDFRSRREQRWNRERWMEHQQRGRRWVGLFLLVIGGLLLARASGVLFPVWFFTWPMILVAIGLFSGLKHGFRGFGWLIPIIIGVVFLTDELTPDKSLKPYIWPIAIIFLGLVFILRPKKKRWMNDGPDSSGNPVIVEPDQFSEENPNTQNPSNMQSDMYVLNDSSDTIDATAIFGGVKKNVLSKNFRGGDITTFMGGAEINLTQADCNGKIMIDCFNMFGGTKLIIPPDWNVQSELVTIFGGIEDKRPPTQGNPAKVLVLDGTCIFGGVEIKSF